MAKSTSRKRTAAKTPVTKARAFGRSLADFPDLNEAEKKLIAQTQKGEPTIFYYSDVEEKGSRTIRAGLVRFLALGGDDELSPHEKGVEVIGASIDGPLDFFGCSIEREMRLINCELPYALTLRRAQTRTISLQGCRCQDIKADGVEIRGNLYLNNITVKGLVQLHRAKVEGDFVCSGGQFGGTGQDGNALACDGAWIGGSVFLSNNFTSRGAVRMIGVKIEEQFDCSGGHFEGADNGGNALLCDHANISGSVYLGNGFVAKGAVRFPVAFIAGDIVCRNGTLSIAEVVADNNYGVKQKTATDLFLSRALVLSRSTVGGTLWLLWRSSEMTFHGGVDLTGARIGRIVDAVKPNTKPRESDPSPIGAGDNPTFLMLDGLLYDRFGEQTDLSADARIAFMRLQQDGDLKENFKPQPWMQMVKVLRESGHTDAAREVAIAYEEQRRKGGQFRWLGSIFHRIYGALVGYGHRPVRLARIALAVWLVCSAIFATAADFGVMAPTNPRIYEDNNYSSCRPESDGNWTTCKTPYEYTTFNSWIYSLDLILPIIDLQQEHDWSPMIMQPCEKLTYLDICLRPWTQAFHDPHSMPVPGYWPFGFFVWIVMWLEILFGWLAGSLFAAVLSGLAKRMD